MHYRNTGSIPMDIEVQSYKFSNYCTLVAPGAERIISTEFLPVGLKMRNLTGVPKGTLKIKVIAVGDRPAGIKFFKGMGNGGM